MIEREVQVIAERDGYVLVEALRENACGHCDVSHGCGTSLLSKWMNRKNQVSLPDRFDLEAGDHAVIGIDEKGLVMASISAYMFPLMVMLIVALVIQSYTDNQGLIAISSLFGLIAGLLIARKWTLGKHPVVLLRKVVNKTHAISIEIQEK